MIWYTKAMAIEWRRFLKTEPCTCGGWLLAVGNLAELLFHGLPQHTEVDSQSLTPAPSWVCLKKCLKMMGENSENRKFPLMIINHHVSIPMMIKHVSWRWTPHVWINPSHRKIQMAELHQVYSGHKCQTLRVVTLHLNSKVRDISHLSICRSLHFLFVFGRIPVLLGTWNECEALPRTESTWINTGNKQTQCAKCCSIPSQLQLSQLRRFRSSCSDILARCGLLWHSSHTMWGKMQLTNEANLGLYWILYHANCSVPRFCRFGRCILDCHNQYICTACMERTVFFNVAFSSQILVL